MNIRMRQNGSRKAAPPLRTQTIGNLHIDPMPTMYPVKARRNSTLLAQVSRDLSSFRYDSDRKLSRSDDVLISWESFRMLAETEIKDNLDLGFFTDTIEPCSVKRGLFVFEESFNPCQSVQSAQADIGRNLSLFLNLL